MTYQLLTSDANHATSVAALTDASRHRLLMRPLLTSLGLTRVASDIVQNVSGTRYETDVWKSSAASNAEGRDWFFLVKEIFSTGSHSMTIVPFEEWDGTAVAIRRQVPHYLTGASTTRTPATDGSLNGDTWTPLDASRADNVWGSTGSIRLDLNFPSATTQLAIKASANALVFWQPQNSYRALYVGLLQPLGAPGNEVRWPLVMMIPQGWIAFSGQQSPPGFATREPGTPNANNANFTLGLWATSSRIFGRFNDFYTGKETLSPVGVSPWRDASNSRRGVAFHLRCPVRTGIAGDGFVTPNGVYRALNDTGGNGVIVVPEF